MPTKTKFLNTVNSIVQYTKSQGLVQLTTSSKNLKNQVLQIEGRNVINFGSCSYLGLEFDPDVMQAAKDAIDLYGTQFSSSRTYIAIDLYDRVEAVLESIFQAPTVIAPTTTLGHVATIPVVVEDGDAIIMDQQAHNSIHMAVDMVYGRDVKVEVIKHNDMEALEERVRSLKQTHNKIWYMADGIYSMFGDKCPIHEIVELLDTYPELHLYVDDAHGMSCYGDRGQGYILSEIEQHPRIIVAVSFAKGFGSGGAAIIFPTKEMRDKVRNCGGPMITSGPIQPGVLGATNKVAQMHISGRIANRQAQLADNIQYANLWLQHHELPLVAVNDSPVFFVGTAKPIIAQEVTKRMMEKGYFLNVSTFPVVPIRKAGIRFTINAELSFDQIKDMVSELKVQFDAVLDENNFSLEHIREAFSLPEKSAHIFEAQPEYPANYEILQHRSITDLDIKKWNTAFVGNGGLSVSNLDMLETVFTAKENALHNQWDFHYLEVRDDKDEVAMLAVATISMSKEDMLLSGAISQIVERHRINDPYYLTSKTLMLGTPSTEGDHVFIHPKYAKDDNLKIILLNWMDELGKAYEVDKTILRDFENEDESWFNVMQNEGYFRYELPKRYVVENFNWDSEEDLIAGLSKRSKKHFKQDVRRHADKYQTHVVNQVNDQELEALYNLYLNVKERSHDMNTFTFPIELFRAMNESAEWEFVTLELNAGLTESGKAETVAVAFTANRAGSYDFPLVGIDYRYQSEFKCYQQMLYSVYKRAKELNVTSCNWGFTADTEKRKFGAKAVDTFCYIQQNDLFSMQAMETVKTEDLHTVRLD